MTMLTNRFKKALQEQRAQIGLWAAFGDAYATEAAASTGFDWLLIDGEHGPNDLRSILAQLQSMSAYDVQPIVRPPIGEVSLLKQYLEIGVQTLLIPMVETAEQAEQIVAAVRYPPRGVRGVGSGLARSSRWNGIANYLHAADAEVCVLVQVETRTGLDNLEAIASVEGVDGVFFGPADLAASLGLLGLPGHKDVIDAISGGIATVIRAGKAPGVLSVDQQVAQRYLRDGALFVAVGVDISLMVKACRDLAALFKRNVSTSLKSSTY